MMCVVLCSTVLVQPVLYGLTLTNQHLSLLLSPGMLPPGPMVSAPPTMNAPSGVGVAMARPAGPS